MDKEKIEEIVSRHRHEKAAVLAILHEVQDTDKHLEMDALRYIAELLKVPFANLHGLATFYSSFSTVRKGRTEVRVCDGISCHINGSAGVIHTLSNDLEIEMGETSWDEKLSLHKVECMGLCSVGPNLSIDGEVYSRLDRDKVRKILLEKLGGSS